MMRRVQEQGGQATFMRILTKESAPGHNRRFDFDEQALPNAVKVFCGTVYDILWIKDAERTRTGPLFSRAEGQSPCLHETLALAAGTMRNSRRVFLMAGPGTASGSGMGPEWGGNCRLSEETCGNVIICHNMYKNDV